MDLFVVSVLVTSINIDSVRREPPPQRDQSIGSPDAGILSISCSIYINTPI